MKQLQLSLLRSSWLIRSALMLLFWMLLQQPNGCFACVEEERIALLHIKSAFGFSDDYSGYAYTFESWNNSTDCCSWDGVSCSPNTKHVKRLDLGGTLGSSYYTLNVSLFLPFRDLRSLILSFNNFNSCIPSDCFGRLAELDSLQYLDLSWNYFDSKALSSLAALGSLKALSLSSAVETTEFFTNAFEDLAKLSSLKYLDLSDNGLNGSIIPYLGGISSLKTLKLEGNNINEGLDLNALEDLAKLSNLKYLDLSVNGLNVNIIPFLGGISSLRTLNLQANNIDGCFDSNASRALSKLRKLNYLDLSFNGLNESIGPCLVGLSSLKTLILAYNKMGGELPLKEFSRLNKLEALDLSTNEFTGGISLILKEWTSLKMLSIRDNEVNDTSLKGLCKMKNLEDLDISRNNLSGDIPLCLEHLSSLSSFDISYNQFRIPFPSSIIRNLTKLKRAIFSNNDFKGFISIGEFANHTELKVLDFSNNNQLEVQSEHEEGLMPSFQLDKICLSNCIVNKGSSSIPMFLSTQYGIQTIDLSNTNLKGNIPMWLFQNKTDLFYVDLRNNSLTGPLIFPSHLKTYLEFFDVSNNELTGEIPMGIGHVMPWISYLNMSHNSLQGVIPFSFKNLSGLKFLDLSDNKLSGQPFDSIEHFDNLVFLDLAENNFQGSLFKVNFSLMTSLVSLNVNRNQLTGEIPSSICKMPDYFGILNIGGNKLSGVLPSCMSNLYFLFVFNVGGNNLRGNIPSKFCEMKQLKSLDLSNNYFSGLVPSCFNNLSNLLYLNIKNNNLTGPFPSAFLGNHNLVTLDMGNNHFIGHIPIWIDTLQNLKMLSLKGNHFEGPIPKQICHLRYLRILDLSQNNLSQDIPPCLPHMGRVLAFRDHFSNEMALFNPYLINVPLGDHYYYLPPYGTKAISNSIEFIDFETKGRSDAYKGNIINYLSGLDLSCNKLVGRIPTEIGNMTWLRALNLSNNLLHGPIPNALSRLRDIESLDLSHNMLDGRIPSQLAELYFLEVFSVAYNNLSGPTLGLVSQFGTFNESSYEGNPYLCGPPLVKNCNNTVPSPPEQQGQVTNDTDEDKEAAIDHLVLFASIALGFIVGFWVWMVSLFCNRNLRYSLFLGVDGYMDEVVDMVGNLRKKMKRSCW